MWISVQLFSLNFLDVIVQIIQELLPGNGGRLAIWHEHLGVGLNVGMLDDPDAIVLVDVGGCFTVDGLDGVVQCFGCKEWGLHWKCDNPGPNREDCALRDLCDPIHPMLDVDHFMLDFLSNLISVVSWIADVLGTTMNHHRHRWLLHHREQCLHFRSQALETILNCFLDSHQINFEYKFGSGRHFPLFGPR